jgi:general secretion pathway protein K
MSFRPRRQRGVAVITALLLTTLAITIVASLFWQQQVQVRSMENQRLHLQTKWILRGALDWARLVLRQDGVDNPATTLNSVWNTPLAETRLDQYIERERVENEVFDATLSGRIVDATSRFNLRNLAVGGVYGQDALKVYKRLLQNLHLDESLAATTAQAFVSAAPPGPTSPSTSGPQVLDFTRLDDLLAIPGYTPEIVAKLHDFAIVLPGPTTINVNTAPAEVLAALSDNVSVAQANALVTARLRTPFGTKEQFLDHYTQGTPAATTYDVRSTYFLVLSRVRLDRAALDAEALISRPVNGAMVGAGGATVVWIRQN